MDYGQEETLTALFVAFNRHAADDVVALMTDDCIFDAAGGSEAFGTRFQGRKEVAAAFTQVWTTFPDASWTVSRHLVVSDRAITEWTFRGTRADGLRLEADGCDLFTFEGGRIRTKSAFRKDRPLFR